MVNYCIVYGCGRNSRINSQINFFSLPKERSRQLQWLRAAGREDLLPKINEESKRKPNYRICSKHFTPIDVLNKHLIRYAVPTLFLPGNVDNVFTDESGDEQEHQSIACNSCSKQINGFRYKCVTCEDFDLCPKCETMEVHDHHFMLRIPKPMKFKLADDIVQKWKRLFYEEHKSSKTQGQKTVLTEDSSDDEPIKKYAKSYDSGINLSEYVKFEIQNEVTRALAQVEEIEKKNMQKSQERSKKREKRIIPTKIKMISHVGTQTDNDPNYESAEELVFADVNQLHTSIDLDVKTEIPLSNEFSQDSDMHEQVTDSGMMGRPSEDSKIYLLREILLRDVAN